ncbi:tellurite resistance [Pseudomonas phage Lana]|uniref:Co-chaperone DjlA N-terminal domain-containing protein n=1 Tax=Pseudomonas phage Lana TaxID=2530172 RepID=A0A481W612_9CAUD|nr:tellurite resistance [Pseudomonas phage Lana]QBJ04526.1 hypothetical protein [Pseudomonas phage Lana]
MFKTLGKMFGKGSVAMKKVENKDLMEAIVGGNLLMAASDGVIEDSELKKLDALVRSNPALTHFGQEINAAIQRFSEQLKADFYLGKMYIKRELLDVANNSSDAEEVIGNMVATARADGEIEPAELVILKEVAGWMNVRLSTFGIEE